MIVTVEEITTPMYKVHMTVDGKELKILRELGNWSGTIATELAENDETMVTDEIEDVLMSLYTAINEAQ